MASDPPKDWRFKLHEVIYESNTPAGKVFDVGLLIAIFAIVIAL
ncbi:hypothetical protein [Pedobacter borealis]|nr:hypothetical protein [Pedobacter borealis]